MYSWTIATTTIGIFGFDPLFFSFDVADFALKNERMGGEFTLANVGNDLNLVFFSMIPEPGTWMLVLIAGSLRFSEEIQAAEKIAARRDFALRQAK